MTRWTPEDEQILSEYASRGLNACVKQLRQQTGIARTPAAVERHAYRMGLSLMAYETCPRCGQLVKRLKPSTGLCRTCNERELARRQMEKNTRIKQAIMKGEVDDAEYMDAKRLHQRARQENSRLARRFGVAGTAKAECGDSEKCRKSLSSPSSAAQKSFGQAPENEQLSLF